MYHFFVEKEQVGEQLVTITGPDVNHIKNVLRMKPGEVIGVSERGGRALLCEIESLCRCICTRDFPRATSWSL